MPHCAHCGHELPETAGFCPACGRPLAPTPVNAATEPAAPALPLGEYLKKGWELFKSYPGGFVGFFLVYLGIQLVLHLIPLVGNLAALVVGPALIMGNFIVSAKMLQGHQPQFSDFFLGFRFFIPLLLTTLVGGALTAIGFVLLIIPGIYLIVGYFFAASLVIDRRLDFWPALELSRRTVQPRWFSFFAFLLLLLLLNLAGAALLGLGLVVTVPLTGCAIAVAYADFFGLQSDYSEDFPDNTSSGSTPVA